MPEAHRTNCVAVQYSTNIFVHLINSHCAALSYVNESFKPKMAGVDLGLGIIGAVAAVDVAIK